MTLLMLEVLCNHLVEKPGLYLDKVFIFLYYELFISLSQLSMDGFSSSFRKDNPTEDKKTEP